MILLDSRTGSKELLPYVKQLGVPAQLETLEFGDVCFEGNTARGRGLVGIERKTLHDMLNSIDSSRYSGHQLPGMAQTYQQSFLIVEGLWKPHWPTGVLMEGFNGGSTWTNCRHRSSRTMYHSLRRYLFSVSLAGVVVLYSRNLEQTAYDVVELSHYFQKPWQSHRSLLQLQKMALPTLTGKPSVTRKWAADLDGIGSELSLDAERLFRTPIALAQADEAEWVKLRGVGALTAKRILQQIHGVKR